MRTLEGVGRGGASLVEVLVACVLLTGGVLVWLGVFSWSLQLLDDAHLGLHAAILFTEASRFPADAVSGHAVGPGRIEVVEGSDPLRVHYSPPLGPDAGSGAYGEPRTWSLAP